jgi:hypothetical protein
MGKELEQAAQQVDVAVRDRFAEMALMLPKAEEADAAEAADKIIAQIMGASSWNELDAPWSARGIEPFIDHPLRFDSAKVRPSDYADGLGIYLVCDVADMSTGELAQVTVGSVSIVAQLVRAWTLGAFPLFATPRKAAKPSKAGYYPLHLEVTDSAAATGEE